MRRTKDDMLQMESDCRYWLTYHTIDLNPHTAYNEYIKYYLESGNRLPHYINGIKDFINISKKMKEEQIRKEQQEQRKQEMKEQQEDIINKILSLPVEQFITAYRQAKETGTEKHKMALCDMAMLQKAGELKEKHITSYYINVCRIYNLV